jgi:hypothetical protein
VYLWVKRQAGLGSVKRQLEVRKDEVIGGPRVCNKLHVS